MDKPRFDIKNCFRCQYVSFGGSSTYGYCDYMGKTGRSLSVLNRGVKQGEQCRGFEPRRSGRKPRGISAVYGARPKKASPAPKEPKARKKPGPPARQVVQVGRGGEVMHMYRDVASAAKAMGVPAITIYKACAKAGAAGFGGREYTFRYQSGENKGGGQ